MVHPSTDQGGGSIDEMLDELRGHIERFDGAVEDGLEVRRFLSTLRPHQDSAPALRGFAEAWRGLEIVCLHDEPDGAAREAALRAFDAIRPLISDAHVQPERSPR